MCGHLWFVPLKLNAPELPGTLFLNGLNSDTIAFKSRNNLIFITKSDLFEIKINRTENEHIVLNKRGFAFIDCPDQVALDKAIEKLSGLKINGKEISVEHSGFYARFGLNIRIFQPCRVNAQLFIPYLLTQKKSIL